MGLLSFLYWTFMLCIILLSSASFLLVSYVDSLIILFIRPIILVISKIKLGLLAIHSLNMSNTLNLSSNKSNEEEGDGEGGRGGGRERRRKVGVHKKNPFIFLNKCSFPGTVFLQFKW